MVSANDNRRGGNSVQNPVNVTGGSSHQNSERNPVNVTGGSNHQNSGRNPVNVTGEQMRTISDKTECASATLTLRREAVSMPMIVSDHFPSSISIRMGEAQLLGSLIDAVLDQLAVKTANDN
jgi:hypothetical protein